MSMLQSQLDKRKSIPKDIKSSSSNIQIPFSMSLHKTETKVESDKKYDI